MPATFAELNDIGEFFQGRDIAGTTICDASIYTERGSEGITMGAMDVSCSSGFRQENADQPYDMEVFVNLSGSVLGLGYYKALSDCWTPPGSSNGDMSGGIDAFWSGHGMAQEALDGLVRDWTEVFEDYGKL